MTRDWYDEFVGYCNTLTDAQVHAVYWKETDNERPAFAAIAKAVAGGRGIDVSERVEWRDNRR
mgnify:CR=1 FL=1